MRAFGTFVAISMLVMLGARAPGFAGQGRSGAPYATSAEARAAVAAAESRAHSLQQQYESLSQRFADVARRRGEAVARASRLSSSQSDRSAELSAALSAVVAQRNKALADFREGLFCSLCKRSKTEIEQSGENFFDHIRRVDGQVIRATPEQVAAKEQEYDGKIASLRQQIEQANAQAAQEAAEAQRAVASLDDEANEIEDVGAKLSADIAAAHAEAATARGWIPRLEYAEREAKRIAEEQQRAAERKRQHALDEARRAAELEARRLDRERAEAEREADALARDQARQDAIQRMRIQAEALERAYAEALARFAAADQSASQHSTAGSSAPEMASESTPASPTLAPSSPASAPPTSDESAWRANLSRSNETGALSLVHQASDRLASAYDRLVGNAGEYLPEHHDEMASHAEDMLLNSLPEQLPTEAATLRDVVDRAIGGEVQNRLDDYRDQIIVGRERLEAMTPLERSERKLWETARSIEAPTRYLPKLWNAAAEYFGLAFEQFRSTGGDDAADGDLMPVEKP